jgi:hypothetical protein
MDEKDVLPTTPVGGNGVHTATSMDEETIERERRYEEEQELMREREAQADAKHRLSIILGVAAMLPLESFLKIETCCLTLSTSPGDLARGDKSEMNMHTREELKAKAAAAAAAGPRTNPGETNGTAVRLRFVSCINISARTTRSHVPRMLRRYDGLAR